MQKTYYHATAMSLSTSGPNHVCLQGRDHHNNVNVHIIVPLVQLLKFAELWDPNHDTTHLLNRYLRSQSTPTQPKRTT